MRSIFLLMLLLIFPIEGVSNTTSKISKILVFEQGNIIYIYPETGVQNPPACHGSNGDYLSFKMSRPMAKEYLSVLMTAFVTNKTVNFSTYGDCIDQSVSETIKYFIVFK